MNYNFELILFYATVITGIICLIDKLFFAKRRRHNTKLPMVFDYAWSFFPVLVIVFFLRSFFFEPFRIPSGSLEPTLLPGDFILVNKFAYGIRLPVWHKKILAIGEPARGDILIFRWPPNPSVDFIKRVIGVPGDHIDYVNHVLYINGKRIEQKALPAPLASNRSDMTETVEDLFGVSHHIYTHANRTSRDYTKLVVPKGYYFVMGDNRDESADSRYWGFVPENDIVGKASAIWMSWDSEHTTIRFNRLGHLIH